MAEIIAEGITDSPAVASSVAYFIMALAGALTLYATTHWAPEKRERRREKRQADSDNSDAYYRNGGDRRRSNPPPYYGPKRRRHDAEGYDRDDEGYEEV